MAEKAAIFYQKNENDTSCSEKIEVMFNPASYSISRNVNYSGVYRKKNKDIEKSNIISHNYPNMTFLGGSSDSLSLELIVNKYEFKHYSGVEKTSKDLSIKEYIKKIQALTLIKENIHKPPLCKFVWSDFSFQGYVTSLQINYTMFLDDGTPVRAKINLNIQGCMLGNDVKIPFESPDRTKSRILSENQQLWEIAEDEYGDSSKWREIAIANNISNPIYIESGKKLVVPALK